MDETTHPLSKKVLDRANTIEFNNVNLDYFNFLMDVEEKEAEVASNRSLETEYLHLKECFKENEDLVRNISTILIEINKMLESVGAQVDIVYEMKFVLYGIQRAREVIVIR